MFHGSSTLFKFGLQIPSIKRFAFCKNRKRPRLALTRQKPIVKQRSAYRIQLPVKASSSGSELEIESLRKIPVLERVQFGKVTRIFEKEELDIILKEYPKNLVILKCKARYCRPCTAYARKYLKFAQEFEDVLFLEIMGDENKETRMLMVEFEVKATPTFLYYLNEECATITVGIKEEKMREAILWFKP